MQDISIMRTRHSDEESFFPGEPEKEIGELTRHIEADPRDVKSYCRRGRLRGYVLGDFKGGNEDFDKALEIDPTCEEALLFRGEGHKLMENLDEAIKDLTTLIELNPATSSAFFLRGTAKWSSRDYDGAIADFSECVKIDPNYDKAYIYRGLVRDICGDYKGMIDDFQKASEGGNYKFGMSEEFKGTGIVEILL